MIGNRNAKRGLAHPSDVKLPDDSQSELDAIHRTVDTIIELLELKGFDANGYRRRNAYAHWDKHVLVCGWMKWAKYKLAAFFAFHTEQDLPAKPTTLPDHPGDLLSGTAQRYLRRWLAKASPEEHMGMLTSILQLKKGLDRPNQATMDKSAAETYAVLTTPTPHIESVTVESPQGALTLTFQQLLTEVKATARELATQRWTGRAIANAFMPSLSSNYNNTRHKFGTLGYLMEHGYLSGKQVVTPTVEEVQSLEEHIGAPRDRGTRIWQITNRSELDDQFSRVYDQVTHDAATEQPITELVPLAEALKVRVISKGPPLTYFCLKPLQKFMWTSLVQNPIFQLIGAPVTEQVLNDVILGALEPDEAYLSGDYKAATDNLRWELSEAFFVTFCESAGVPEHLITLGKRALTGHIMTDPKTGELKPQRAGQLMGSIISFPVLCGVNAAVCRWALSLSRGATRIPLTVRLANGDLKAILRLLINGDDCLFPINAFGRQVWRAIARMAGLEESVGKCYYSRDFANVNSTNFLRVSSYDAPPYGTTWSFKQTGYVNFGLLRGLKRSGGKVGALDVDGDLGSRHAELLRLASGWVPDEVLTQKFISANHASLQFYTDNALPWFVPKEYGGVGLLPCGKYQPSRDDVRTVRAIVSHSHPRAPRPTRIKEPDAFILHEATKSVLESLGLRSETHWSLVREPDAWNVRPLYLWCLYMMPSLVHFMLEERDQTGMVMEQVRNNRKCWLYYRKHVASLPPPFSEGIRTRWLVHDSVLLYA